MKLNKRCPDCPDGQLVERMNHHNGSKFLGCSNWPDCTYTEPLPAYVLMVRAGAPQLPGMDDV